MRRCGRRAGCLLLFPGSLYDGKVQESRRHTRLRFELIGTWEIPVLGVTLARMIPNIAAGTRWWPGGQSTNVGVCVTDAWASPPLELVAARLGLGASGTRAG